MKISIHSILQTATLLHGVALPVGHATSRFLRGPSQHQQLQRDTHRQLVTTTGTRSVLVVRVVAADNETEFSEAELGDTVFGHATDPVNLRSQILACSQGKLEFVPANDRTLVAGEGTPEETNITAGVTTVKVATVTQGATDTDPIEEAITAALTENFNVTSPSELADHVMYCLPPMPDLSSSSAYASKGGWKSVYPKGKCVQVTTQMHEIGHNLNLGHANENGIEYGDQTGTMGPSYDSSDNNGPLMCYNSAKYWQLGWLTGEGTSNAALEWDGVAVHTELEGIVGNWSNGIPKVIKINDTLQGNEDFFVSFNRKTSFNSGTQEGGDKVMIVRQGGEDGSYVDSSLVAILWPGQSYTIDTGSFSTCGVTVVVTSIPGDTANVGICDCNGGCPNPTSATYTNAVDTMIWEGNPDTNYNLEDDISVDDSKSSTVSQALLKFPSVSIPSGAVLVKATLQMYTNNDSQGTISAFRMIQAWSGSSTWNSLSSGVTADGVEAASTATFAFVSPEDNSFLTVDVTSDVSLWLGGASNQGWVFINNHWDGWDFDSAETSRGPVLTIEWDETPPGTTSAPTPPVTNAPTASPVVTSTPAPTTAPTAAPVTAPTGSPITVILYAEDTQIWETNPDTAYGTLDDISVDKSSGGGVSQALVKFPSITTAIPAAATVVSAELQLYTNSASPGTISAFRMMQSWSASTSTWNSLNGGVTADGVEAASTSSFDIVSPSDESFLNLNVAADVSYWVGGGSNQGWVFISDHWDGWDFDSAESSNSARVPSLTIVYTTP